MTRYEYMEEVKEDVKKFVKENLDYYAEDAEDLDELKERLYNGMWNSDLVTGNPSGSYTFNAYKAEVNLAGAWDLLQEALEELGDSNVNILDEGAEWCDVAIRCYLLGDVLEEVAEEMQNEWEESLTLPFVLPFN